MVLLLGTDVARLDQPGHYRVRASRLGRPFLCIFGMVCPLWTRRSVRGRYQGNVGDRQRPVLLPLGLHREERNPFSSTVYVFSRAHV